MRWRGRSRTRCPRGRSRGAVVAVRFGRAQRRGIVTEVGVEAPPGVDVAPVDDVVDAIPPALVELALWLAGYYGSTPARALELVAPRSPKRRKEQPSAAEVHALPGEAEPAELTDSQRRRPRPDRRRARRRRRLVPAARRDRAAARPRSTCRPARPRSSAGAAAIVLVPEIALTPQTVGRFRARFGDGVALLHSGLADAARRDERQRVLSGEARVVVGARSAVFAPVRDLGLICVDEEHDPSYKQESDPRYDARTVAAKRAALEGAVALFGSATPRPESWARLERIELGARLVRLAPAGAGRRPAARGGLSALGAAARGARRARGERRQGDPAPEPARRRARAALPRLRSHDPLRPIATSRSSCTATARCAATTAATQNARAERLPGLRVARAGADRRRDAAARARARASGCPSSS